MSVVAPETRIPFVHRAHPEVYGRLFAASVEDPLLLARVQEARGDLTAPGHPLQALSRHTATAREAALILGDFAPAHAAQGPVESALALLEALAPYEHFLREVGTSLKAPLVRPKGREIGVLRDLADLCARHLDLFRPAAKWLITQGVFGEGGCALTDPPATFRAPSMRRFFASPLRATEAEEYEDAGGTAGVTPTSPATSSLVVVYIVTVGPGWDEAAAQYAHAGEPYRALLANALGAGAADTAAKDLNDMLDLELLGGDPARKLRRLSPGYGDWPLSDQRALVGFLNPERDLGVHLNEGDILIPEKSTSGIMAEKRREEVRKIGS
jgi:hypothetical protein